MNYKLKNDFFGNTFDEVAEQAKIIASEKDFKHDAVEFEFNGAICLVDKNTSLERLWRDYSNHFIMDWETVGPDCPEYYSQEVQAELDRRNNIAKEKEAQRQSEANAKNKVEREDFEKLVSGIEVEIIDREAYAEWKAKNADGYGACIFQYAEGWAKLMQERIAKGETVVECAEKTSHQLGFLDITGFMYGAAVAILSKCWKYGEELRRWHNKEYNHEGQGVANPAVITIGTKN